MANSSAVDPDDSDSESRELAQISSSDWDEIDPIQSVAIYDRDRDLKISDWTGETIVKLSEDNQQPKIPKIVKSITIPSTGVKFDITAQLDLLMSSIELSTAHPADPIATEWNSLSPHQPRSLADTLSTIAIAAPITSTNQLLQQLQTAREEIVLDCTHLQSLHQQDRISDPADTLRQDRQIRVQTHRLALQLTERIEQIQELLATVDRIRVDIATRVERVGGQEEMLALLTELETTRDALIIANDRLSTGQAAYYDSFQTIQTQLATHSQDLALDPADRLYSLTETVTAEELQLTGISLDLSLKFTQLESLNSNLTNIYTQVMEKSQVLRSRISEIDRGFTKLSASVPLDIDQFHSPTTDSISTTDELRLQVAQLTNQISAEQWKIDSLKAEIAALRQTIDRDATEQSDYFDLHFYELMANWSDLSLQQKAQGGNWRKFSIWLSLLSVVVGAIFVMLVRVLISLA